MTRPRPSLDTLRARVRRFQLVAGLGFVSAVLGPILVAPAVASLNSQDLGLGARLLGYLLLTRLWVWLVLPVLSYGLGRIVALNPLPTAIGAAVTGELIGVFLDLVSGGVDRVIESKSLLAIRILSLTAGIVLSRWAIVRARAQASVSQGKANALAEKQKDQYAEFAREAERIAALHDARAGRSPSPAAPADTGSSLVAPTADSGTALVAPTADSGTALVAPTAGSGSGSGSGSGTALVAPIADTGSALVAPASDASAPGIAPSADSGSPEASAPSPALPKPQDPL